MLEQATGKVVILASQVSNDSPLDPGSVINYANDADIAEDGTIYFTTSSDIPVVPNAFGFWDTYASFTLTMLKVRHSPQGPTIITSQQSADHTAPSFSCLLHQPCDTSDCILSTYAWLACMSHHVSICDALMPYGTHC